MAFEKKKKKHERQEGENGVEKWAKAFQVNV